MDVNRLKGELCSWIDENKDEFSSAARYIWEQAELSMEEVNSSAKLIELLEKYGFEVERGVAGVTFVHSHCGRHRSS